VPLNSLPILAMARQMIRATLLRAVAQTSDLEAYQVSSELQLMGQSGSYKIEDCNCSYEDGFYLVCIAAQCTKGFLFTT